MPLCSRAHTGLLVGKHPHRFRRRTSVCAQREERERERVCEGGRASEREKEAEIQRFRERERGERREGGQKNGHHLPFNTALEGMQKSEVC